MKPVIAVSAGIENTSRDLMQFHLYQTYADSIAEAGGIPIGVLEKDEAYAERIADLSDGLLLTGGNDVTPSFFGAEDEGVSHGYDPWRDEMEWKLCEAFIRRKKPILGICRGFQVLNCFLGGGMIQDIPTTLGVEHKNHSIHTVRAEADSVIGTLFGKEFTVNSYHHQALGRIAEGVRITASAENGRIAEALEHASLPVIAVQWHPERMRGAVRYDPEGPDMGPLFRYFCGLCSEH